jgi:chromosome segregation ATPase
MNDLLRTENMKLEMERQAKTKELREIENDRSKYISVNRLEDAIESERKAIDAQVKDKYLTEFMHLKSMVKAVEKKEQNALAKLDAVTKEKEILEKEIKKTKSNNLETELLMAESEDIIASLSEEKESLTKDIEKLKKDLSNALKEISFLKEEINRNMSEKSENKEKDHTVEKMEFTMSDSESIKGSKGFVYRSSQNKDFLHVQEERRLAIRKKIIERKDRIKRARERYEKEKLRKRQKEKEDEEALKEQEMKLLNEKKSKEEEEAKEKYERICMNFEEVCAPKRYKNYFATFFDPKKKVPLPHRGETNEKLNLSLLKEEDLPHISNHFKNISMAFGPSATSRRDK